MTIRDIRHHTAADEEILVEYRVGHDIEIVRTINGAGQEVELPQDEHDAVMCRIEEIELDAAAERSMAG